MGMYDNVHEFVRKDRVKHTIKENMKLQAKYKPKPVPRVNEYHGSTTNSGPSI